MLRAVACLLLISTAIAADAVKTVTWTGWFSDADCAASRAKSGIITATNPDCAKECIEKKGIAPVFLSEQAKAMFTLRGYAGVVDDLGYHVQVQGRVDEAAKTIEVLKVTRLEFEGAVCGRPSAPKK